MSHVISLLVIKFQLSRLYGLGATCKSWKGLPPPPKKKKNKRKRSRKQIRQPKYRTGNFPNSTVCNSSLVQFLNPGSVETDAWSTWLHQVTKSLADPDCSRLNSFCNICRRRPDTNFHTFYNRFITVKTQIVQKRFKHFNISCNDP